MKKHLTALLFILLGALPLSAEQGALRISSKKDDIFLEIPDSLIGRKVLLNTYVTSATSPYVPLHKEISANDVYTITKVDSSIVFRIPNNEGKLEPIQLVLPISGKASDSLSYKVKATKLFAPTNKSAFNLKNIPYASYYISEASYDSDKSKLIGVENGNGRVCVRRDVSFTLTLEARSIFAFELSEKFPATFESITTLTLLEPCAMQHKEADTRIGTRNIAITEYPSDKGSKKAEWVLRWNVEGSNTIDIYLDTLLTPAQRSAISEGLLEWNRAFEACNLGKKINVYDYPGQDFDSHNPMVSVVTLSGQETDLSAAFQTDGTDRILSIRMYLPANYVESVRKASVFAISKTDPRYLEYDLCEEAICEVLKAQVIKTFGLCLGLKPNLAASHAYSPSQLTNPRFVEKHGFTASVTDDVLFNYLATAQDKAAGVKTVVDRIGEYDEYAIGFIYGNVEPDNKPEHFYAASSNSVSDYRVRKYDLSNDPFADFAAGIEQIKYVAQAAPEYLRSLEDSGESYRTLFLDWLWLRGNNMMYLLTSNIGGYEFNALREDSRGSKYKALPADVQRKSLNLAYDYMRNVSWMDESELLHMAGANKNVSDFTTGYIFQMLNASFRFKQVALACENAGSKYSVDQYLKDLEKLVFKEIKKGDVSDGEITLVGQYVTWLGKNANVNSTEAVPGMCEASYRFLTRALDKLEQCRSKCRKDLDRYQVEYLIALTNKKINLL